MSPEVSGRVVALHVSPGRRAPMLTREQVEAVTGQGFALDAHARPGTSRQVLLMDAETLDEFCLRPGEVKENITTRGFALGRLAAGMRLQIGEALLEITKPCNPCSRMDEIQPGLQEKLQGRRGMLARVVVGGAIRVGDTIEILEPKVSQPG